MSMKIFLGAAFVVNTLLGNLCMMPMAQSLASNVPVSHEEHMEMAMMQMTPVDCEHCSTMDASDDAPMQRVPCDGGSCFMDVGADTSISLGVSPAVDGISAPAAHRNLPVVASVGNIQPQALSPPGQAFISTTVLRC